MTDLLLATCAALPDGEPGAAVLDAALAARGIEARWAVWDDPAVDWSSALVALRSTWDYEARREELLAWARTLPRVLNGAEVFAWNTDKAYLPPLADRGVPIVPSRLADGADGLRAALAEVAPAVVKPRVGAGGSGLVVVDRPEDLDLAALGAGPWLVQPLVESIRTEGETSVFVLDGEAVSQVVKRPGDGEVRVHPQYGGRYVHVPLDDEAAALALRATAAAGEHLGTRLDYARVDLLRLDGALVLGEIELTEPALYLDLVPTNAEAFADLVVRRLGS